MFILRPAQKKKKIGVNTSTVDKKKSVELVGNTAILFTMQQYFGTYDSDAEERDPLYQSHNETDEEQLNESCCEYFQEYGSDVDDSVLQERPGRKKRKSFADIKAEKLNYAHTSKMLASFQSAAYQCCSFLCDSWLTTALILFCREKYLLIDTTKGRQQWLVDRLEEMEKTSKNAPCTQTLLNSQLVKKGDVVVLRGNSHMVSIPTQKTGITAKRK
jgi:hypothetical protein